MSPALEIGIACFTILISALSAMTLFIVSDLRDRIARLESRSMGEHHAFTH